MIRATAAHAFVMAEIHQAAFPPEEAWSADAIAAQLAQPGVIGLLSPEGGLVLARVAADEAEILTIGVLPAARRQGLGRRLLEAAMEAAARDGAETMFLEVSSRNLPARVLYEAAGFITIGQRARYYADGSDAFVQSRRLISGAATVT